MFVFESILARILELGDPFPKSHILCHDREIRESIKNQEQTDMPSGSVKDGSVKN